jgi:hypothetical protein
MMRALILSLSLIGCRPGGPRLGVDYNATQEQREAVIHCVGLWNGIIEDKIRFADDDDVDEHIMFGDTRMGRLGCYRRHEHRIIVAQGLDRELTTRVVCHEIGHMLGLGHTRCGVMTGEGTPALEFCADDLEECAEEGACETP